MMLCWVSVLGALFQARRTEEPVWMCEEPHGAGKGRKTLERARPQPAITERMKGGRKKERGRKRGKKLWNRDGEVQSWFGGLGA